MPNINNVGEYDWILKQAKRMDPRQIMMILRVAFIMNEVTEELIVAKESGNAKEIRNKQRLYDRWKERYDAIRQKSVFFYIASSYINADILRPEYFEDEFAGDLEDVLTAILSTKPRLSAGNLEICPDVWHQGRRRLPDSEIPPENRTIRSRC